MPLANTSRPLGQIPTFTIPLGPKSQPSQAEDDDMYMEAEELAEMEADPEANEDDGDDEEQELVVGQIGDAEFETQPTLSDGGMDHDEDDEYKSDDEDEEASGSEWEGDGGGVLGPKNARVPLDFYDTG